LKNDHRPQKIRRKTQDKYSGYHMKQFTAGSRRALTRSERFQKNRQEMRGYRQKSDLHGAR